MNVLGLFDGISCGRLALDAAEIPYENYYASEINVDAIKVSRKNFPSTIQLGSVTDVFYTEAGFMVRNAGGSPSWLDVPFTGHIDLLLGGSPCQGLSYAGKQLNLEDHRSKLFFEYVRILQAILKYNPDLKFLLENVRMKGESEGIITKLLGVQPRYINSSIWVPQNRDRIYWSNIPEVPLPAPTTLTLADIIETDPDPKAFLSEKASAYMSRLKAGKPRWKSYPNPLNGKAGCLTKVLHKGVPYGVIMADNSTTVQQYNRFLTPKECEILQGVPINYTDGVGLSFHNRRGLLGDGWTVQAIAHQLKGLKT